MDIAHATEALHEGSAKSFAATSLPSLRADAVVFTGDETVCLDELALRSPGDGEVIIETEASSISAGTEKLFWSGQMPPFPGMGYPLVPGYETVGTVTWAKQETNLLGRRVFVPGAHSFETMRSLFGGASSRLIAHVDKTHEIGDLPKEEALLLSLAATAYHAVADGEAPDLIVGFGPLGRLLFRISIALGAEPPAVWETNPARQNAEGLRALTAETDDHRAYRQIYDASGNAAVLDSLVNALERGGTLTLAGFYTERLSFAFPPAFQKEARLRIAAEWQSGDLEAVRTLVEQGKLSLSGLVSHTASWADAASAYRTAFNDPHCLKMILDWETP